MEPETLKVLVPAVASLVGAIIGAGFGAFWAFRRFRHERAYDRQLDWYERTVRALHELVATLASLDVDARHGNHEAAGRGLDAIGPLITTLNLVAAERYLYGMPAGRRHLDEVLSTMEGWFAKDEGEIRDMVRLLHRAAWTLSDEARREFFPRQKRGGSVAVIRDVPRTGV